MKLMVLIFSLLTSPLFAAEEMKDNSPLLIDFARAKMLRRVETQNTFYFEVCDIPADIARQVVDATFENLRALKDKLPCKAINDIRLNRTNPRDQFVLETQFNKELQITIMAAFHKASDQMAVVTGFGQIISLATLGLALRPLSKNPGVGMFGLIMGIGFQMGTLFTASVTHKLWIRTPPQILDASANNALSVNPKFYVVPPAAGRLDGSMLFEAFLSALNTAMTKVTAR